MASDCHLGQTVDWTDEFEHGCNVLGLEIWSKVQDYSKNCSDLFSVDDYYGLLALFCQETLDSSIYLCCNVLSDNLILVSTSK